MRSSEENGKKSMAEGTSFPFDRRLVGLGHDANARYADVMIDAGKIPYTSSSQH